MIKTPTFLFCGCNFLDYFSTWYQSSPWPQLSVIFTFNNLRQRSKCWDNWCCMSKKAQRIAFSNNARRLKNYWRLFFLENLLWGSKLIKDGTLLYLLDVDSLETRRWEEFWRCIHLSSLSPNWLYTYGSMRCTPRPLVSSKIIKRFVLGELWVETINLWRGNQILQMQQKAIKGK